MVTVTVTLTEPQAGPGPHCQGHYPALCPMPSSFSGTVPGRARGRWRNHDGDRDRRDRSAQQVTVTDTVTGRLPLGPAPGVPMTRTSN